MFNEKSSLDYILKQFPKFHDTVWRDHFAFWVNEEPGYWNNISAFAHYIMLSITKNGDSNEIENAFRLAEEMIEKGNENVKNAICTNFLEDILNTVSSPEILLKRVIPFLGEKSKHYCKAWDEFTGVKAPGLWD